jgi:hypothetical protein
MDGATIPVLVLVILVLGCSTHHPVTTMTLNVPSAA